MTNPDPRPDADSGTRPATTDARAAAGGRGQLSIGSLSRATGIPVETLRTWETRYGFPVPERKPSGHRTYPAAVVPRLRRIADALSRGHRASHAVGASEAELSALLEATPAVDDRGVRPAVLGPVDDQETLLNAVAAFDADRLTRLLLGGWARFGPIEFLDVCIGPLVREAGERWSRGEFEVRHEHFLSERVSDLLRTLRLPFEHRATGPLVVFATLPGEAHGLGLQMAALVVASAGCRVLNLGTDLPTAQIAALATDIGARAVALSISRASAGQPTDTELAALRRTLSADVRVLVGGEGAPASSPGIERLTEFSALERWARALLAG